MQTARTGTAANKICSSHCCGVSEDSAAKCTRILQKGPFRTEVGAFEAMVQEAFKDSPLRALMHFDLAIYKVEGTIRTRKRRLVCTI